MLYSFAMATSFVWGVALGPLFADPARFPYLVEVNRWVGPLVHPAPPSGGWTAPPGRMRRWSPSAPPSGPTSTGGRPEAGGRGACPGRRTNLSSGSGPTCTDR